MLCPNPECGQILRKVNTHSYTTNQYSCTNPYCEITSVTVTTGMKPN